MNEAKDEEEAEESQAQTDPRFYLLRNAAESGEYEAARQLITEAPSIVAAKNSIGETAFHFLVVEDEREAVQWLLAQGSDINTRNAFGNTPLMEAALLGYRKMCRFLLEQGADLRARDSSGDTAISEAAQGRKVAVLRFLLSLLEENEDINSFFSNVTAHMVLSKGGRVAELLRAQGLVDPWQEE